jgi:hypothetical protein
MQMASPILDGRVGVEHEQAALMDTSTEEEWKRGKETKAVDGSASRRANVLVPRIATPQARDATNRRFSGPFSDFTDGHTHILACA